MGVYDRQGIGSDRRFFGMSVLASGMTRIDKARDWP
jgi:hypothetical protein